jgi:hypothetical protein
MVSLSGFVVTLSCAVHHHMKELSRDAADVLEEPD